MSLLFFPIATLFLSIAVVAIAWQQWRVAENKLRLDLFDRRYKVYDAIRNFLRRMLGEARFDQSDWFEFYAGIADAEFLFGSDVLDYLAQLRTRALNVRTHQALQSRPQAGDELSRHAEAENEQLALLDEQLTNLTNVFSRYLGFAHIALRRRRVRDWLRRFLAVARRAGSRFCVRKSQ